MADTLLAAARSLLLPIAPAREEELVARIAGTLNGWGVGEESYASWVSISLRRWAEERRPSAQLTKLVRQSLFGRDGGALMFEQEVLASNPIWEQIANLASQRYFEIHEALVVNHLLDHDFARQLLAQAGWIARLAVNERMSASEITRVISAREPRLAQRWEVTRKILDRLEIGPSVSIANVQQGYEQDSLNDPNFYGDLDLTGSINHAATAAASVGCAGDIEQWLTDILVRDCHEPYLLILHYQMMILAQHDHPPTYAYEFKPRGQAVTWLNQQYIDAGLPVALSAFLNNAKATLRFDRSWVAGRPDHTRAATAMAGILQAIETLGALARVEVASRLRALLRRYIRLREQEHGPLPSELPQLGREQIEQLLQAVAAGNSGTTGILEQRLVEMLGVLRHPRAEGWAPRGLGDSVFAPNLPRRKCGDCEFERATQANPAIHAYEAHGGQLSAPYVEDHLSTLTTILRHRSDDLVAVAPLAEWEITVTFVSHGLVGEVPRSRLINTDNGDLEVNLVYITFAEIADELANCDSLERLAAEYIVTGLNSPFVHPSVRRRTQAMLA